MSTLNSYPYGTDYVASVLISIHNYWTGNTEYWYTLFTAKSCKSFTNQQQEYDIAAKNHRMQWIWKKPIIYTPRQPPRKRLRLIPSSEEE